MKHDIAITGMGAVTPIGIGIDKLRDAVFKGTCGTAEITLFDTSNFATKTAAEVKGFDPKDFMLPQVFRKADRFTQLGVAAARMAVEDAKIEKFIDNGVNTIPVIIGSGLGGSLFHEEQIFQLIENQNPRRVLSSSVPRIAPNAVSAFIAMEFKFKGPNLVISTACSSGGNAISYAAQLIREGHSDIVITGGVECPISPFTYAAYQSLRVLSSNPAFGSKTPRPFDKSRDGFVLGEGAGILVLENYDHAIKRGAPIYAKIAGYASNCGAYHMAAPDPSGDDAALAISNALKMAGIKPADVSYINAHGTATQMNDLCESKAINKVFGFAENAPLVSSTKSQTGHTIGAAGAIEAIITALAIKNKTIPPNINCSELDEECKINVVMNDSKKCDISYAISNSFGFGSNNSVLVFARE